MCGICGKLLLKEDAPVDPTLISRMSSAMMYRGPDDSGIYTSRKIGFGHGRLSIIDLQTGKQPLSNENGTVWVVFNGEIYNFRELRNECLRRGHTFKTHTDTEVIVHLYEDYGEDFVSKLRGMFAIALWDETSETLILARDRVGIKPLYYFMNDECLVFGSEIKSILADNVVSREVDLNGLRLLLAYYYIPGEDTLLKGVKRLLPGHCLTVRSGKCVDREYWDLSFSAPQSNLTVKEAEEKLVGIIKQSVRDHMISDVPVGFLLSGGVDSTALLSFAVEETDRQIKTFTIGFEGAGFADERYYAGIAAKKFGTDHYDLSMTANEFREFLPGYVWHMEEPVCEPPGIALYYVSKLAKDHVKVLISGEGGDEAFAGYQNYRNLVWLENIKKVAGPFKRILGQFASFLAQGDTFGRFNQYGQLMRMEFQEYYFGRTSNPFTFFNKNTNNLYDSNILNLTADNGELDHYRKALFANIKNLDVLNQMLYIDSKTWLPDDLLVKADRMTMANSIELRVPLLDHTVLEYAASLPSEFKLKGATTKYILKKAFEGRIPPEILCRKKTGFPIPYEHWLANDLKDYVQDLLLDQRTLNRGYFQRGAIAGMLAASSKRRIHSKEIFLLIVLELWHRCFIDQS
ncbi:MAG: Asparagine synthetase (glutamine-hydrolyzing) [Nitrospira sp.]|nr:MAG: Asparagine synthetase (glutamine-hydrolyzing) [Nitrospira sp.]